MVKVHNTRISIEPCKGLSISQNMLLTLEGHRVMSCNQPGSYTWKLYGDSFIPTGCFLIKFLYWKTGPVIISRILKPTILNKTSKIKSKGSKAPKQRNIEGFSVLVWVVVGRIPPYGEHCRFFWSTSYHSTIWYFLLNNTVYHTVTNKVDVKEKIKYLSLKEM